MPPKCISVCLLSSTSLNGLDRGDGSWKSRTLREGDRLARSVLLSRCRIELAKETLRSEGFYDPDAYRASLFMIDKWLEAVSSIYFPTRLTVVDNQFGSYSIYSSKDLMRVVRDETQNPFLSLFRDRFIPSIVNGRPDLIGVSITATSQIIPGLTLCRLIKEAAPDLHVTIGGSIFTRLVDNIRRCPSLFELTDDIVCSGRNGLAGIGQSAGRQEGLQ